MNLPDPSNTFYIIALGLVGLVFGLQKALTMFGKGRVDQAKSSGEYEIITLLREQIAELVKANKELRGEIGHLRDINNTLIIENETFKAEVRALKRYIERFIDKYEVLSEEHIVIIDTSDKP